MTWCIIANGRPIRDGLEDAVAKGASLLKEGESAIKAVIETIRTLEDDPRFDAGTGCDLNLYGLVLMDASIMDGRTLNGGAVGAVSGVKNPILIAQKVMETTPHVFLVGKYAEDYAKTLSRKYPEIVIDYDASTFQTRERLLKTIKVLIEESPIEEILSEKDNMSNLWFKLSIEGKLNKIQNKLSGRDHGTVSAIALDQSGDYSAGASTGGWTLSLPGRIGDSPLLGCGAYADNSKGASSTSGIRGEENIRLGGLTRRVCDHMEIGQSSTEATQMVTDYAFKRIGLTIKRGSLIAIDRDGEPGFNLGHQAPSQGVAYLRNSIDNPRYLT
jgi:beta-aspartyl-peptidase (threonine type)